MALSFGSGSVILANWGFSVGDVAVLAGAGRKAGTWVMAQFKDRMLLDWMKVDIDTVFRRKGLFETADLHDRWDQRITLLKNAQRTSFQSKLPGKIPSVQQMDRFTWLMTLLTAALDAAMQKTDQRTALTGLLLRLFEEYKESAEFLQREADEHIQGWMSAACVRNIALKARDLWEKFGSQGKHQQGYIPDAELNGVIHFLYWLIHDDSKLYSTASTDIFSLAMVLEELGMKIRTVEVLTTSHVDESEIIVAWSNTIAPTALVRKQRTFRPGMRIPLSHMEEVASLVPESLDRNKMRSYFQLGMDAVKGDGLYLQPRHSEDNPPRIRGSPFLEEEQDLMYFVCSTSTAPVPRLNGDVHRFADWLFPVPTPAASAGLLQVVDELSRCDLEKHNMQMIALSLDNQATNSRSYGLDQEYNYGDALQWLQAFFLGYWYQLLLPLLDTTQLAAQEAFGSWAWGDIYSLNLLRQIVRTRLHARKQTGRVYKLYRFEIMKLVAYLFGGAERSQVETIKFGAVGILGKLPVLYASLVGARPGSFGKFCLLDIDPSCIPSGTNGAVSPGNARKATKSTPNTSVNDTALFQHALLKDVSIRKLQELLIDDFTIHIEPDWEYDSQTCLVTYRHRGRVVHRLNPRQVDLVLAGPIFNEACETSLASEEPDNSPPYLNPIGCDLISLTAFEGGRSVEPEERLVEANADTSAYSFDSIIANVSGAVNAMVCLACIHQGWAFREGMIVVSSQEELTMALDGCAKVILVTSEGSLGEPLSPMSQVSKRSGIKILAQSGG